MKSKSYSATPLAKKLGLQSGFTIRLIRAPEQYYSWLDPLPKDLVEIQNTVTKKDFIHCFADQFAQLVVDIPVLRQEIKENGMIWVSWHKKSSKIPTDLDENLIRELGLAHGLVDVKVCSINESWSALKFVIRLKDRKKENA